MSSRKNVETRSSNLRFWALLSSSTVLCGGCVCVCVRKTWACSWEHVRFSNIPCLSCLPDVLPNVQWKETWEVAVFLPLKLWSLCVAQTCVKWETPGWCSAGWTRVGAVELPVALDCLCSPWRGHGWSQWSVQAGILLVLNQNAKPCH